MSLLWKLGYHGNQSKTSITHLSQVISSSYLVWRFLSNNVNNSFVLCRIESIFAMEVLWDDGHQPHTSLLWKLCYHGNQSKTAITHLLSTSYLVWRFRGVIGISHVPFCLGNLVAMAIRLKH